MERKIKVYLSGPMTGYPEHNFPAFYEHAALLRQQGYAVFSPAELTGNNPHYQWADYIKQDLRMLLECDQIALMPGWEKSRGARLELMVAVLLGFKVLDAFGNNMEVPEWFRHFTRMEKDECP